MIEQGISDQAARQRALDPAQSFIIQAPAGSGKTGLLVQRYLSLLALVDEPEEILAITFTRKATGEMRERVLQTLQLARSSSVDELSEYEQANWHLARVVLTRDSQRGWRLLEHPSRLRILTIDALNASLTRQLPLLSGFGSNPRISERAQRLYQLAARRCLRGDDLDDAQYAAVALLLDHMDADYPQTEALLAQMLAQRQQWQSFLYLEGDDRERLEHGLQREVEQQLQALNHALQAWADELMHCARFAAEWVDSKQHPGLAAWRDVTQWPGWESEQWPLWQGLSDLLLTAKREWRKSWTIKIGVPAKSKDPRSEEIKNQLQACVASMSAHPAVLSLLQKVPVLPPHQYDDAQWEVLAALLKVLRLCSAHLQLVFQEQGEVDYTEVALRAVQALGDEDAPTDLALKLDYRIRHLLVDEFQDTSKAQVSLLRRLTEGWEVGDGRSLFLVGDPMQSIYRFRQAEVSLFLQAQQEGLGPVELETLHLSTNFRSRSEVVDWVNASFSQLFPAEPAPSHGTMTEVISYTPSSVPLQSDGSATSDRKQATGVMVHPILADESQVHQQEALKVAQLAYEALTIQHYRGEDSENVADDECDVAILVRRRNDLVRIIPALRDMGLSFEAVEIESLAGQPVVQDLLALTRALLHRGDQLAWAAILRAPWCGLELAQLDRCVHQMDRHWPQRLASLHEQFEAEVAQSLERVGRVLLNAFRQRRRLPLRQLVEITWQRLGGAACLQHARERADADAYFQLLEGLDKAGDCGDPIAIEDQLQGLFARPDASPLAGTLKLMTIHKAKGLEFDTVILPGLAQRGSRQQSDLLQWCERPRSGQQMDLLLGPLHARGGDADPIQVYIRELESEQQRQEQLRLLYVATTRAKRQLHLVGALALKEDKNEDKLPTPIKGSLLKELWPLVQGDYEQVWQGSRQQQALMTEEAQAEILPLLDVSSHADIRSMGIRQLSADWQLPQSSAKLAWVRHEAPASEPEARPFAWAGMRARHIGTVVHAWLERMAETGIKNWNAMRIEEELPLMRHRLGLLGIPQHQQAGALERVQLALNQVLADDKGRWILSSHQSSDCELALNAWLDGRLQTLIIDRTFVCDEGIRWIVDYKTSALTPGGDLDEFIQHECERYRSQLQSYARVMYQYEQRPVRTALYLPMMPLWIDIDVSVEEQINA